MVLSLLPVIKFWPPGGVADSLYRAIVGGNGWPQGSTIRQRPSLYSAIGMTTNDGLTVGAQGQGLESALHFPEWGLTQGVAGAVPASEFGHLPHWKRWSGHRG